MQKLKIILFQTGWQTIAKIFSAASTLILIAIISRNYGESGIGLFTLTAIYLGFFYLAADLGLNGYVIKKIDEDSGVYGKVVAFRIVWSVFLAGVSILLLPFLPFYSYTLWVSVCVGSFSIVANSFFSSLNILNQKTLKYNYATIAAFSGAVFSLITGFVLVYLGAGIQYLALAITLNWIFNSLVCFWLVRKPFFEVGLSLDFRYIVRMIKNTWPISATLIINTFYFRIDTFILSSYYSISDVGKYNLAYSLFQDGLVIPTFLMNSYYPIMLDHFRNGTKLFLADFKRALLYMSGMGLLAGVAGYFLAPMVIMLISGGDAELSGSILQILSFSVPAFFLSALLIWTFMTLEMFKRMLIIYFVGLIVNVSLNAVLIPIYSFWAAAWVTVISEYLILMLQVIILIPEFRKLKAKT